MISVFNQVKSIVGQGENAGYQHFLLYLQYFEVGMKNETASLKVGTVW